MIQQPDSNSKLNSPDHALSHRVFANDENAPNLSVTVDAAGNTSINGNVAISGSVTSPDLNSLAYFYVLLLG